MTVATAVKIDESTPARILYQEPVMKGGSSNANVECRCGLVRYNAELACPCGATNNIAGYRVFKSEEKLLTNNFAVKSRFWYHSTTRENWDQDIKASGVLAHVGNEQTAHQRALDKYQYDNQTSRYYLYKLLINPFASIADNISPDLIHGWTESKDELYTLTGAHLVRYVNTFENGGSVSLYGDPNQFIILGATTCII